jgi:thiol-disulfide isomerase/thioredoxin
MDPVGIGAVVAVLLAGTAAGVWRNRTSGRLLEASLDPAVLAGLVVEAGERATLLQFSSAHCAPCRAVRRISSEVAGEVPGVRHIEVDAEQHLDAVRALGIWRTPTLLILDSQRRIVKRATGVPEKPQLIAAVTETL